MDMPQLRYALDSALWKKTRSFDDDKCAAAVQCCTRRLDCGFQRSGKIGTKWIGDADMGHQPLPEERANALLGVVKDLVGDDDATGGVFLAQGAAGIDADDAIRSECF